jgi:hypothetical protein
VARPRRGAEKTLDYPHPGAMPHIATYIASATGEHRQDFREHFVGRIHFSRPAIDAGSAGRWHGCIRRSGKDFHATAMSQFPPISDLRTCRWPEPALLLGEPVYQHVDERAHLGGQMPAMGIERIDFALLRPVAGQQRHQRSRGQ